MLNQFNSCSFLFRWHFIGTCQTNKVNKLMTSANLTLIETVTSTKLANKINSQVKQGTLGVFVQVKISKYKLLSASYDLYCNFYCNIQVNTSGEENKNGIEPANVVEAVKHIVTSCSNLKFCGLMTIGDLGNSIAASAEVLSPGFSGFHLLDISDNLMYRE